MLFSDDIVLVDEEGLEHQSKNWRMQARHRRSKSQHLFCDLGGLSNFTLDGVTRQSAQISYISGHSIRCNCDIDRVIKNRISAAWTKW